MTQMDNPYLGNMDEGMPTAPAKTSGLAITSLVCSVILCCPITTIIGVLLGLISFFTIGANPAKKGRGLAVTAVLLGLLGTAGWVGVAWWGKTSFGDPQEQGPEAAMIAAFNGDPAGFRAAFTVPTESATDAEIAELVATLEARFGAFLSCQMDEQEFAVRAQTLGMQYLMQPVKVIPYNFNFANGVVDVEIEVTAAHPDTGEFLWGTKFGAMRVLDPDDGDIVFPPGADITVPGDSGDEAASDSDTADDDDASADDGAGETGEDG